MNLTQERLHELMSYDSSTGLFRWTNSRITTRNGHIAGCICATAGYVLIRINGTLHCAHRLAFLYMTGSMPIGQVDHINGIKSDNRWENLRSVSNGENHKNKSRYKNNTSGRTGVYKNKITGAWVAKIRTDGVLKTIGSYRTFDEAVIAREAAENVLGFHKNHDRTSLVRA